MTIELPKTTFSKTVDTDHEKEIEQEDTAMRTHKSTKRKYIYCTSCGKKADVESRYCTACGTNLHKHLVKTGSRIGETGQEEN